MRKAKLGPVKNHCTKCVSGEHIHQIQSWTFETEDKYSKGNCKDRETIKIMMRLALFSLSYTEINKVSNGCQVKHVIKGVQSPKWEMSTRFHVRETWGLIQRCYL